jgi:cell division protein FtsW (lipid II flippase)
MSPLFKDRARWVGVAAVTFAAVVSSNLLIRFFAPDNFYLNFLEYCIVDTAGIVTLAWIDTTIKVARRSDPLNRNTFHWKQLRYFVWFFTFLTTAGSLFSVLLFRANYFNAPGGNGGAFIAGSFGWVFLGLIALYLSFRRSRDSILREHLKWLGLFLFLLLLVDTVLSRDFLAFRIADEALLALDSYFLYRAAKSLAPLSTAPLAPNPETVI